jgi:hypothetical protein
MIFTPSFNNQFIFGIDITMVTVDPPREVQVNAFSGVNGVEILDHGARQRYTNVAGRLLMPTLAELAAAESNFRSYKDPYSYTLVTTEGLTWPGVKLESFQPIPPIRTDGATGQVWRNYQARFIHTI